MPPSRKRAEPEARPSFISTQVTEASRYYLDLAPEFGEGITVACGGCERMRPDYVIDRADFPFLAVELVAEGCGSLRLAGGTYRLTPGVVFAYGPGVSHVIRNDPARPMLKYYVNFVGEAARLLLQKSALRDGGAVHLSAPQELIDIFELLQREGASGRPLGPAMCAALLSVLLMKISEQAFAYGAAEPRALETYQRAKRVLEARFLTLQTAEEAAGACHMTPAYLCRLFQRFAHATPYQFITKLKMNHAAALLLDQRMLVKEVADALAFADAFHFSRTFKRVYGISPERFVRQSHVGRPE